MTSSLCKVLLLPISFLYGVAVRLRGRLFDSGCIASESYPVPVICVGNLAVGGTGKTPHTEYIIRLLKDSYRVAVLSRGYKRRTTGFLLADNRTSREIGDEPYQMKRKFPDIVVAVDEDRREGVSRLLAMPVGMRPQVILLDDAFQHRRVKPSLSIVLTDCRHLFYKDTLLPAGRLREPACGVRRADMVVVTKCRESMTPADRSAIEGELHLQPHQKVFFSHITYNELKPVFPRYAEEISREDIRRGRSELVALAGIASPEGFFGEVRKLSDRVTPIVFPDHHAFSGGDMRRVGRVFESLPPESRYIIVTEKDAARLADNSLVPEEWKVCMYSLPITTVFFHGERSFDDEIKNHIRTFQKITSQDKQYE